MDASAPQENTIKEPIGLVLQIESYEGLVHAFNQLTDSVSSGYKLKTDDYYLRGPLVKYGIVDLVYQKGEEEDFIRVFGRTQTMGVRRAHYYFKGIDISEFMRIGMEKFDTHFPLEVEVIDCCQTNDQWVWSEKYFYS